ncbi:DUF1631 family protein [Halioglobus pacificus]|uniref:Uncharacterized protein n=1 Tax=Parahalioglobus pacificus TaxID=930806 RepID=A0A919CIB3_9GAMM|nr:DUF1631 family protein [Halioglobus pacificus]GHD28275.1 hypothetical protein GCM10007053_07490 [Halioglobus pacificus]
MSATPAQAVVAKAIVMLPGKVRLDGRVRHNDHGELIFLPQTVTNEAPEIGTAISFYCEGINTPSGKPQAFDASISNLRAHALVVSLNTTNDALQCEALHQLLRGELQQPATPVRSQRPPNNALIDALKSKALELLDTKLQSFCNALNGELLDLASTSKTSSQGHNLFYEAMNACKRNEREIINAILGRVRDNYGDLTPAKVEEQSPLDGPNNLDLVDINEYEDFLAVDRMVTAGEELHRVALEALTIRMADVIQADPLKIRVPNDILQLCRGFHAALNGKGIPHSAVPAIFDFFQTRFLKELADYYSALNGLLEAEGIKSGLENEISAKGTLLNRPQRQKPRKPAPRSQSTEDEQAPSEQQSEAQPTPWQSTDRAGSGDTAGRAQNDPMVEKVVDGVVDKITQKLQPTDLYRSVIDALNFRRGGGNSKNYGNPAASGETVVDDPSAPTSGDDASANLADADLLSSVLGALQQDSSARSAVQEGNSLRSYLAENAQNIDSLKDTAGLAPDTLNQLDLIDNLFGTIRSQVDVSQSLKPALGDLQIPLAKLALNEPQFFVDRGHSARAVLDKLSKLSSSANFPNKALENRVGEIVGNIVKDYDQDSSVFDSALSKIDKLVNQQESAHQRNVERVVRTQEGQERLAKAQREVDRVLGARIRPPSAPKALADLAEAGWRDMLVLTHVKEGANSPAWKDQVKNLDTLALWLTEQMNGSVEPDQQAQRSMESDSIIDMIGQQISSALPASIAHEPVLQEIKDTIAGECPVATKPISTPEKLTLTPRERRDKINTLPRLRRWVRRAEQVQTGTWLSYKDSSGHKQRMQLAWISEDKDRYIFVNERGQKSAELSSVQLARQLSRGVQPPPTADKMSLVDQSMYGTLEHVQKTLSFDRNHDALTKLINRSTFEDQMKRALRHAHRRGSRHAVLVLNIDNFGLVNDVYDRVNGDQVLLEFAKLLSQMHGKKTSSARLGDDEFGVLLIDRPLDKAMEVANKICKDIAASEMEIDGEKVTFTVSIGVAPIRDYSNSVDEVLQSASGAMGLAKDQGRNRAVQYTEEQSRIIEKREAQQRSKDDLEKALATDRFVLRAQPIVKSAADGSGMESKHYELLLSLTNKDGSLASPEEFIQSAERYGFMSLVDRWVVREAFQWISELIDAQKVVPSLAINLSGHSVTDDGFLDYLLEQISEFGVGTSKLCFEITETGTISNLVKAADFVRTFRNIGCKFSIDDFGTGLASHNYLRELPVDYVKIDGTFITNIHKNRNDYAMARSINDLAHFLGQETIAESVENDEIIETLQEIGVDYFQGWGVGRPKLLTDVTAELSQVET